MNSTTPLVAPQSAICIVMRYKRLGRILLAAAVACILSVTTYGIHAAEAANPRQSAVVSGGSVAATSATHRVSGAIGQVTSFRHQSATHQVADGFWNTVWICDCPHLGDLNQDNKIDILDVVTLVNIAFRNAAVPPAAGQCPLTTDADTNCDDMVSILDVVTLVETAFRNNDKLCKPCTQTPD